MVVVAFTLLPLVFMMFYTILDSYITALILTFSIYLLFSIFLFGWLKKQQDLYDIIADEKTLYIKKHGTFTWDQISGFDTFKEIPLLQKTPSRYLRIYLKDGTQIKLNTDYFDIEYKELERNLRTLKNSHS
ncbi:MAG: hypothetical protein JNM51_13075 [Bacteroidia bacterium]|nr:hypothetical protein [Bacteroidia bacterium]